jgi:membrane-associated phospholipid phosphatase
VPDPVAAGGPPVLLSSLGHHMSQGSARGATGWVLLGGGLASLMGVLILTAIVTQQRFERADGLARAFVQQSHHPRLRSVMEGASFLGGHPGQIAVVVLGSVMLWHRRRRWAVALPVAMTGAGVVQFLAKLAVDRARPNLDPWGYPSGHLLSLVVLLGFVAYVVSRSKCRARWRHLGTAACAAAVCTVAYSRLYLDAHWLSDVLGGIAGGLAYLLLALWLVESIPPVGVRLKGGTEILPLAVRAGRSTADSLVATTDGIVAGTQPGISGL